MPRDSKTGVRFEQRNADAVRPGDSIKVHGSFMLVRGVEKINRHPIQLVGIKINGLPSLVVPVGWSVKVAVPHDPTELS